MPAQHVVAREDYQHALNDGGARLLVTVGPVKEFLAIDRRECRARRGCRRPITSELPQLRGLLAESSPELEADTHRDAMAFWQ
jgi:hypothetical protein